MAALAAAAAARPDPVETLQEEAICAICLDYFADPVSIGCGHNFCRGCISRLWAREEDEDEDEDDDDDEDEEEDALDVEQEEEDEEQNGGGVVEEEEDDEMWEEEEEEEEEGALWEEPAEDDDEDDEEEEEEEEEEEPPTWRDEDGLYFTDNDYNDAMEEDVEEEEEEEEEEHEDDDDDDDEEDEDHHPTPPLFTCPQCRKSFFQRDFRPNLQLANMVQIIRELHPRPAGVPGVVPGVSSGVPGVSGVPTAPGGPPELCPEHQEPLKLFCQEEQAAICVVCREARQHRRHSVLPLDEALQECKKQLQRHLEPLREQLDAVLKQKSSEEEKISVLRDQLHAEAQDLEDAVAALQRFVAAERALQLRRLRERHEAQLALQRRNVAALELHRSALQRRIAQAEAAARQEGLQMLKDIKGTFLRCENIKFQEPEMVPVDLGKKFRNCFLQDAVMRKMEKVFSKVPQADITLDPSTAHPRLILSHDRRSVRLSERRADVSRRCDGDLCVLGTPGFGAGRHYWEVEVGGRRGWAVGAAGETHQHRDKTGAASPKREIWALGASGKKYQALTATEQTALAPGEEPRRFGVYLDYERGQLGFYNAESMSHIHTFHIRCRQRVFPFFRVLAKGTRIRICTR